jgi:hypothetical protein
MNTMVLSPMQHDYVTKKEFGLFEDKIEDRFGSIDKRFDGMQKDMRDMHEDYKRYLGMLREGFREDLKVAFDHVQSIDDKKIDKRDFEELKREIQIRFYSK